MVLVQVVGANRFKDFGYMIHPMRVLTDFLDYWGSVSERNLSHTPSNSKKQSSIWSALWGSFITQEALNRIPLLHVIGYRYFTLSIRRC